MCGVGGTVDSVWIWCGCVVYVCGRCGRSVNVYGFVGGRYECGYICGLWCVCVWCVV